MTRWCPICESQGLPVLRGDPSVAEIKAIQTKAAIRVGNHIPGIVPSHFCSRCPTFFRGRDRFYLTGRREHGVHGIAVWPHGRARVRVELAGDGHVLLFRDDDWVLLDREARQLVMTTFFREHGDINSWSRRRGFSVRPVATGNGHTELKVSPAGPHFPLLVLKTWAQTKRIRTSEIAAAALSEIGANPVVNGQASRAFTMHALP